MFSHSHQYSDLLKAWNTGEQLTSWTYSVILISSSDLKLEHQKATYILEMCSTILVSASESSNTRDWLTNWMCIQPIKFHQSNTGEWLTFWICIQPFMLVVMTWSNVREQLTNWIWVQLVLSVVLKHWRATHMLDMCSAVLVCGSQTLESDSLARCVFSQWQPFLSVVLICSNTGEWLTNTEEWVWMTHKLDKWSAILISGSNLFKWWRATHKLDMYSAIFVSDSDLLKHWRLTSWTCSAILISSSDLLKHWRVTHILEVCLSVVLICRNTREQLTR